MNTGYAETGADLYQNYVLVLQWEREREREREREKERERESINYQITRLSKELQFLKHKIVSKCKTIEIIWKINKEKNI